MSNDYVVWAREIVIGSVGLDKLKGLVDKYRLADGESLAADFPPGVSFAMNLDNPTDVLLTDNLFNIHRQIVASERLKDFLAQRDMPCVEFLPVQIINHKGRAIKEPYFIAHPIKPVDCLDLEQCEPTWSLIDNTAIQKLKRLVLNPAKVDTSRQLFRALGYDKVVLARRDLAEAMDPQGFTGVRWKELADYRDG